MAEDDEDESFGDFHFASFPNLTVHSVPTPISVRNSSSSDSWGEFIATPKSNLSGGPADTLSPPPNNSNSKTDHLGPGWVDPVKAQWVKRRGALPLSIFGELEEEEKEEEESGAGESRFGDGGNVFSDNKKGDSERKGSGLNVNDLIANLYGQNQPIKTHNRLNLNSNGSEFNTNMNGFGSDSLKGNVGSDDFDEDDDDGWEFKAAGLESRIGNGDSKVEGKGWGNTEGATPTFGFGNGMPGPGNLFLVSNGTSHRSGEWGFGFDFNSSPMTKEDGFISGSVSKSKDNDTANGMYSSAADKKVDSVKDFWEFKDAFPETGSQHKLEDPKVADTSLTATGVEAKIFDGDGVGGSVDLFALSDGVSQNSREWDSGFNFNPSFMKGIIADSYSKGKQNDLISSLSYENVGANKNFWEFKDAFSESGSKHKSEEPKGSDRSPACVEALTYDVNCASNLKDSWVASDGISPNSAELEFGFNFNPTSVTNDDIISESYPKSKQNGLNSSPVDENDESGENFGEFRDALSETGSKHEEEYKVADYSPDGVEAPAFSDEIQRNEVRSENHREPLPMAIFSDRNLDSDDPFILKDASTVAPASNPSNSVKSPSSNVSINDLISSLYSQAEQNVSVDHIPKASDNGMHSPTTVFKSDSVNIDDDFDEDSWDFKAADSGTRADDQSSDIDLGDSQKKLSTTLELNDCVDFYCKLKDELCSVVLCHLDNLKRAQSTATLSGEEAKAKSLDEEIKEFSEELHKDNLISKEVQSENLSPRDICFSNFLEVLQEPKFQALESEYQLSRRLSLAEKEVRSAIEVLKDVESTLTILKLGSMEEQQYYVSAWSNILSICIEELKHGALIWKQSVQKNIQSQILSEPQGKRYILALGEIYRVVEVLGASAKLYKPWIFLYSGDTNRLVGLLSECYSIWSSSGLEDALESISDHIDFEYDGTIKALLESVNYIHNIDALALQNLVFSGQPMCRLSALTAGTVPGLRLVVWNGEHYFLTLANLWANLISCDSPKLPRISGS
ncbi:uncharacterized protein LOC133851183 isoform X3 [Alnus glutinosa]|uniref:uncharacterized protein LOC133851183 isoform X3 n=1 Tax=Alnus glutinosa TaxID=3517 RepID=UPI002D798EFB|nr:uncharacterized protein LOC133851183 isoform X3 [Alnus glutinosa]